LFARWLAAGEGKSRASDVEIARVGCATGPAEPPSEMYAHGGFAGVGKV
jgi:hypothetical protein